jgi:hypothetical protein
MNLNDLFYVRRNDANILCDSNDCIVTIYD